MFNYYLIGKLAEHPRGKRLLKSLGGIPTVETPERAGVCLGSGQDYQTRTPAEQRQWLAWAARPGCALLLVPPFQTAVRNEPNGWELARLEIPPTLDRTAHSVLRLTLPEISASLARGLSPTLNTLIDGGTQIQLNGLFRKHPDSGIFAVTAIPVWSLALADHVSALTEWLAAWLSLAGRPADTDHPEAPAAVEPKQSHYSVLLYLISGKFPDRATALAALAWNDTFEFGGEDVPSLMDELEAAGLISHGTITPAGRSTLLASPYRPFAEAYLNPPSPL